MHLLVHGFLLPCQPAFLDASGFPRSVLHDGRGVLQQGQDAASRIGWRTSQQEGKGWARHRDEEIKGLKKTTERHRKTTYLNIWIYLTVFESFEEFFSWFNLMCSNFFAHLFGLSRWKCPKLQDHYQMLWLGVCFFWYHILHSQESVKRFWKNFWWILPFYCWIQDLQPDSLPHNFNDFPVVTLCHVS